VSACAQEFPFCSVLVRYIPQNVDKAFGFADSLTNVAIGKKKSNNFSLRRRQVKQVAIQKIGLARKVSYDSEPVAG
jgi:hypothetical protein